MADEFIHRNYLIKQLYLETDISFTSAVMQIIQTFPAADVQPVDRWISCKDKMPEDGQDVITLSEDRVLNHAVYDAEKAVFRYGILIINPTHWIPLPPMPEAIRRDETCTVVK